MDTPFVDTPFGLARAPRTVKKGLRTLHPRKLEGEIAPPKMIEQCQMVVFVADDLGFWGPRIPDLVTELCPPQDTA